MKLRLLPRGSSCSATAGLTFVAPKLRRCPPFRNRITDVDSSHLRSRSVRSEEYQTAFPGGRCFVSAAWTSTAATKRRPPAGKANHKIA